MMDYREYMGQLEQAGELDRLDQVEQIRMEDIFSLQTSVVEGAFELIRQTRYRADMETARSLFFNLQEGELFSPDRFKPSDNNNFLFWFLCDFQTSAEDRTPMEIYLDDKRDSLSSEQVEMAEMLIASYIALYDVISEDPDGSGVVLRNLFKMHAVAVEDTHLSELARQDVFFALRLINWKGVPFPVGDVYAYPNPLKETLLYTLRDQLMDHSSIVAPTLPEIMKKKGYVFNHFQISIEQAQQKRKQIREEVASEKEALKTERGEKRREVISEGKAHYSVEDFDGIRKILDDSVNTSFLSSEPSGKNIEYSWSRKPETVPDGKIILTKGKLVLVVNSGNELEDGKNFITKNMRPLVKFMYDEVEKRRVI